jgi:hypothetical protein
MPFGAGMFLSAKSIPEYRSALTPSGIGEGEELKVRARTLSRENTMDRAVGDFQ